MMFGRKVLIAVASFLVSTVGAYLEGSGGLSEQAAWAASAPVQSIQAKKPVYTPPIRGAPTRRVGAATRGSGDDDIFVTVLAPEGTGLTSRESPTLYWYVSRAPTRQVAFALIRDDRVEPVAEVILDRPDAGGITAISFAVMGVKLEPGTTYEWSIALVKDPLSRSTDIVTSGTLRRKIPGEALVNRLDAADFEGQFALYGEAGYWYDAIELASKAISSTSTPMKWRNHRASFLEQVGLERVAAQDRST